MLWGFASALHRLYQDKRWFQDKISLFAILLFTMIMPSDEPTCMALVIRSTENEALMFVRPQTRPCRCGANESLSGANLTTFGGLEHTGRLRFINIKTNTTCSQHLKRPVEQEPCKYYRPTPREAPSASTVPNRSTGRSIFRWTALCMSTTTAIRGWFTPASTSLYKTGR